MTDASSTSRSLPSIAWFAIYLLIALLSIALGIWTKPRAPIAGALWTVVLSIGLLALCWRAFEQLLHIRFPTKQVHTVAFKNAARIAAAALVAQVVLALAKM